MKKQVFALSSIIAYFASVLLFVYGIIYLKVLSTDKILVSTLACTCPDFKVIFGQFKLNLQIPDSISYSDAGEIFATGEGSQDLGNYLDSNYRGFGDYFLLTGKVIGVKQVDEKGDLFNPLVDVTNWQRIDSIAFWALAILDVWLILIHYFFYIQYKKM